MAQRSKLNKPRTKVSAVRRAFAGVCSAAACVQASGLDLARTFPHRENGAAPLKAAPLWKYAPELIIENFLASKHPTCSLFLSRGRTRCLMDARACNVLQLTVVRAVATSSSWTLLAS